MTHPPHRWTAALVVLALASPLRADYLPAWTYSWSTTTPTLQANSGTGSVTLTPDTGAGAKPVGGTTLVAASITTSSTASPNTPALFTTGAYQLGLTITDKTSGLSHTFDFGGNLTGSISSGSALLSNTYTSPTSATFDIGSTAYTVAMTSYLHPGPPGSSAYGAFGATVTVAQVGGGGTISGFSAPEPSSLLLCGLGAAGCAFAGYRRRRAQRLAAAAV
jgi:hypothetical protein